MNDAIRHELCAMIRQCGLNAVLDELASICCARYFLLKPSPARLPIALQWRRAEKHLRSARSRIKKLY